MVDSVGLRINRGSGNSTFGAEIRGGISNGGTTNFFVTPFNSFVTCALSLNNTDSNWVDTSNRPLAGDSLPTSVSNTPVSPVAIGVFPLEPLAVLCTVRRCTEVKYRGPWKKTLESS